MKRFIFTLGAIAVLLGAMSSPLLAARHSSHSRSSHGSHGGHGVHHGGVHGGHGGFHGRPIHGLHHGYGGYLGRDYRGWSSSCWNARYRCQFYYCPQASCYYYYYAPSSCYMPVSQIATYPPSVNIVNNNNVNVGSPHP